MFLALILVVALSQIPDAPVAKKPAPPSSSGASSGAFELQGDVLGESLEAFVAQHPKAQCDTSQPSRDACYQWKEVSIFGLTAAAGAGCTLKKRYAADCLQGITARFTERRLTSLVYTVAGVDKSPADVELKKKLGAPTRESRESTVWNSGNATLSVVVGKAMGETDSASMITISISVAN
jgi:hypothetical protein